MPEMGESVTEGTVLEWHEAEGDAVAEGDTVVEVSTDKVDAEVPAPVSGTITKLLVSPDETVQVGQALAEIAAGAAPEQRATRNERTGGERSDRRAGPGARRRRQRRRCEGLPGRPPSRRREGRRPRLGERLRPRRQGDQGRRARRRRQRRRAAAGRRGRAGEAKPLRGPAAMLAKAMDESRSVPTATSFRTLPVDTLDAKRKALNGALKERGMKVSFTHLVAWAIVQAGDRVAGDGPQLLRGRDGKPHVIEHRRASTSGSRSTSSARTGAA